MSQPNRWILGARPRTLPAAIAPVLVGTALAAVNGTGASWLIVWRFACALIVAVAVQVATNYANDYSDGVRGTDDPGSRVGPPRLVGNGLATPGEVKRAMLVSFGVTLAAGLPLVIWVNPALVLVGIASVAAGWFYTGGPKPYGYAGFGEVFVFVFFGLVATIGSFYVQTETITWHAVVAGAGMGFLSTALLVVNNLRDIPSDTASGKNTLAVRLGDQATRYLYLGLLIAAVLCIPILGGVGGRPGAVLALLAVPVAQAPLRVVLGRMKGPALIPALAGTGRVQMVYGIGLAIGLLFTPIGWS